MKTQSIKLIVMSAIVVGIFNVNNVQADIREAKGALYYNNRAYVHAIHNAPNPVKDTKAGFAKIAYADKAYGQAIYSYPSPVVFQETDFIVEYVDTANGQAIYSYPNNNSVKPHLELSDARQSPMETFIVPVASKSRKIAFTAANP